MTMRDYTISTLKLKPSFVKEASFISLLAKPARLLVKPARLLARPVGKLAKPVGRLAKPHLARFGGTLGLFAGQDALFNKDAEHPERGFMSRFAHNLIDPNILISSAAVTALERPVLNVVGRGGLKMMKVKGNNLLSKGVRGAGRWTAMFSGDVGDVVSNVAKAHGAKHPMLSYLFRGGKHLGTTDRAIANMAEEYMGVGKKSAARLFAEKAAQKAKLNNTFRNTAVDLGSNAGKNARFSFKSINNANVIQRDKMTKMFNKLNETKKVGKYGGIGDRSFNEAFFKQKGLTSAPVDSMKGTGFLTGFAKDTLAPISTFSVITPAIAAGISAIPGGRPVGSALNMYNQLWEPHKLGENYRNIFKTNTQAGMADFFTNQYRRRPRYNNLTAAAIRPRRYL